MGTPPGADARARIDLLVVHAALATPLGSRPAGGSRLGSVSELADAALAIDGGKVLAVDASPALQARYAARETLDAEGRLVVPGFVDAHTHPVFAGDRADEYELRARGASYQEIAAAGGGIQASVRAVRGASRAELLAALLVRLERFLRLGTTTIEAKSGYGLALADELKLLEALAEARARQPVEIVPTFLGAHALPEEFRGRAAAYVDAVVAEWLPEVARRGLAEYADVFVERGYFEVEHGRRILSRARDLGLRARLHADQLSLGGGAELAAELGAASADHLEHVDARGIEALARAGTIPVLCPLVPLVLRESREAPARELVRAGLAPALATDFNPGTCYTPSMHEVITAASLRYRFSAAECLTAATLNAACSLGRGERLGTLEPGKDADLVLLDLRRLAELAYDFGRARVRVVVKRGRIAFRAQDLS